MKQLAILLVLLTTGCAHSRHYCYVVSDAPGFHEEMCVDLEKVKSDKYPAICYTDPDSKAAKKLCHRATPAPTR